MLEFKIKVAHWTKRDMVYLLKLHRCWAGITAVLLIAIFATTILGQQSTSGKQTTRVPDPTRSSIQLEGLNSNASRFTLIRNITIHADPYSESALGSVLIDGSRIRAVGTDLSLPAGTRIVDGRGQHCYPAFINCFHEVDVKPESKVGYWNEKFSPETATDRPEVAELLPMESMRKAGFGATICAPKNGIVKGQSSLWLLSNRNVEHLVVKSGLGLHLELTTSRGSRNYPNSPMGAVALARQGFYDGNWYFEAWRIANNDSNVELPERNASLEALRPALESSQPVFIETSNELFVGRANRFAKEFGLNLVIVGSGNEYRRLDEVASVNCPIVVPVKFPTAPDVSSAEKADEVTLEDLMHWDLAPENLARLEKRNLSFALTAQGLKSPTDFLPALRVAVKRGLSERAAIAAATIGGAKILGVENQLGTIENGKIANLLVTDGDIFEKKTKILETWVDGVRFQHAAKQQRDFEGKWKFAGSKMKGQVLEVSKSGKSIKAKISTESKSQPTRTTTDTDSPKDHTGSVTVHSLELTDTRLTGSFRGDSFGTEGIQLLTLVFLDNDSATGTVTLPSGKSYIVSVERIVKTETKSKSGSTSDEDWDEVVKDSEAAHQQSEESSVADVTHDSSFDVCYPLGAFGRTELPTQPKSVLIKNVTVWTLDEKGKVENGAILFGDGYVKGIFDSNAELPVADRVIDGKGAHVTPGIIDCHSHMATDSGVNESGQAITAEVRIGDMIDCDDITIYRQLAGGVTAANILHGSANPIGGQNQVIKLRWGAEEQAMKLADAPLGIKFALGENVKQSNWSSPTNRYPQTRMGVEQIMDNAFRSAIDYASAHERWKTSKSGLPPRINLELEALSEIVDGKRWVHCHSYRQDEILALIRTLDRYEITIGSFQHILEGYKVADAMAQHGAMASAFADWWAYKYEVKDAIPYAGALMHRAGVVVSFNSDDGELGRHLNQEAAKAVKYGGVDEVEALKFVTLNPARQLRIDHQTGSLEAGKDADLVLWNAHPLSNYAVVQQTWIDGRKYFDRAEDQKMQKQNRLMRLTLIQKILESNVPMETKSKSDIDPAKLWPRHDEFCHDHHHDE
ncbi:MAG: amidohydrolase family protein [Planctomycetota bacterium]